MSRFPTCPLWTVGLWGACYLLLLGGGGSSSPYTPAPTHSPVSVALLLLSAGESPDSPLGLCPEGKERGCLFLLLGGRSPGSQRGLYGHHGWGELITGHWGWESRHHTQLSLTPSAVLEAPHYGLVKGKSRLPLRLFRHGWGCRYFFVAFGSGRVVIVQQVSSLLGCSSPSPLVRDRWLLLALVLSARWCFWVAGLFSPKSRVCEAKRKSKAPTTVIPWVLTSLASLPSLCLSESSDLYFTYNIQGFSCTERREWACQSTSTLGSPKKYQM